MLNPLWLTCYSLRTETHLVVCSCLKHLVNTCFSFKHFSINALPIITEFVWCWAKSSLYGFLPVLFSQDLIVYTSNYSSLICQDTPSSVCIICLCPDLDNNFKRSLIIFNTEAQIWFAFEFYTADSSFNNFNIPPPLYNETVTHVLN